jgi:Asp/Glu/Hydantoin racemase
MQVIRPGTGADTAAGAAAGAAADTDAESTDPTAGSRGSGVVTGGKNLYGRPLGILMLQSSFPRVPGDAGNASTWPFPVSYRVVDRADPETVVRHLAESGLLDSFAAAAQELEAEGVAVVTTNCGFLVLYQDYIQSRLHVPFVSSSLLQVAWLQALLPPDRRVGIITLERASLTAAHLAAAGAPPDVPVLGMEDVGGYFLDAIVHNRFEIDTDRARAEHVAAAQLLLARHPEVAAIVLECTNMPPYAAAVRDAVGLPVHDITTMVGWVVGAHRRTGFTGWM